MLRNMDRIRTFHRFVQDEVCRHWTLIDSETPQDSPNQREQLVDQLRCRYGLSQPRAEREIDHILAEVSEKLRMAA